MTPIKDRTGMRFGKIVVLRKAAKRGKHGEIYWECRCDCGRTTLKSAGNLKQTKSCGCVHGMLSHGHCRNYELHPLYRRWANIKTRCLNAKSSRYQYYGARGIKICERWMKFENFLEDMGEAYKSGTTIERRDVNGDYTPANCYWASWSVQQNNKRNNRLVTIRGVTKTAAQWAHSAGMITQNFVGRLRKGWTPEDALTIPIKHRHA